MLRVSSLTGRRVLLHKKTTTAKDGTVTDKYTKFGRVRAALFTPDGKHVAGFVIKRPDVAGMIKRGDAFLAWDSFRVLDEKTVLVTRADDGLDDAALRRLDLDWDRCIMWSGMDAKTTAGKALGYVSDAEYDERTSAVTRFFTADGGMARALIGSFVITPDMVRGYRDGFMIVEPGEKSVAQGIVYDAFKIMGEKLNMDPMEIFKQALSNITPVVEVKARRVGGANYQVPVEIRPERRQTLAIRWLVINTRKRSEREMSKKLAAELMDAYNNTGGSVKKKEDTHRMAEANKAFAHFRF